MCLTAFTCLDYSEVSVCKCHGGPGSSSPVETRGGPRLSAALCGLIAFTQLRAELNDALVPVLRQQKHEETQADDEHGDQTHCVEINITRVEVHHCKTIWNINTIRTKPIKMYIPITHQVWMVTLEMEATTMK